jgi:acetyltransferase-like isoleucine patch superfamily enzyme
MLRAPFRRLRQALALASILLPWVLRRRFLNLVLNYQIDRHARVGFSLVSCDHLIMEPGSSIGHLTVIKSIDLVHLAESAKIGSLNWISGIGLNDPKHFGDELDRRPQLLVGRHASITGRHMIDCSNAVTIGAFATIAGAGTHILTHAIDLRENRQRSGAVEIGRYCFVGAACVVLKGAKLPDYSVLAANSTLHKQFSDEFTVYSGVPALPSAKIDPRAAYFHRLSGHVP